ncbi:hypothetical protein KEM48_008823 [Puccinia striiformis f. sp. tritici PST-130]|nr:hypothetical protein KEM48_008823 [Puccinia striiformis f. sp. tritici PST-130]
MKAVLELISCQQHLVILRSGRASANSVGWLESGRMSEMEAWSLHSAIGEILTRKKKIHGVIVNRQKSPTQLNFSPSLLLPTSPPHSRSPKPKHIYH